jgi:hypothetical protein
MAGALFTLKIVDPAASINMTGTAPFWPAKDLRRLSDVGSCGREW